MAKEVETLMENNTVRILSFVNNEDDLDYMNGYDNIDVVKIGTLSKIFNVFLNLNKPHLFAIRGSLRFSIKLYKIVKKYNIDTIHAEYTAMGQYYWIKRFFPNLKINLVEHDVVDQSYERLSEKNNGIKKLYYCWQKRLVHKQEKKYCMHCDNIFVLNNKDKLLLSDIYKLNNVYVLNPYYGIDFHNNSYTNIPKKKNSICFIGLMNREENHEAAMRLINIFKSINRDDYSLTIIGAYPKDELLKENANNIKITGFVEDIVKEISKNEIAVFPLEMGAGIKFKVLQAFGLGLPIITTIVGAEGIDEEGKVLTIVKNDDEIQDKIVELLENKAIIKQKSQEGIEYVKDHFDWSKSKKLLEQIYK